MKADSIIITRNGGALVKGRCPGGGSATLELTMDDLFSRLQDGSLSVARTANGYRWSAILAYLGRRFGDITNASVTDFLDVLNHPGNRGTFRFRVTLDDGVKWVNGEFLADDESMATKYTFWHAMYQTFTNPGVFGGTLSSLSNAECVGASGEKPWFYNEF
jgi:hypothetical protein